MDLETIAALSGELAAVKLAVIAIIRDSPQREAIETRLRRSTDALISNTLTSPFPDISMASLEETMELILRHTAPD